MKIDYDVLFVSLILVPCDFSLFSRFVLPGVYRLQYCFQRNNLCLCFVLLCLFVFFSFVAVPYCMWDLSSPTWDWTQGPCIGSAESQPLDCQEGVCFFNIHLFLLVSILIFIFFGYTHLLFFSEHLKWILVSLIFSLLF